MMIVMREGATEQQVEHVVESIQKAGAEVHLSKGEFRTVIGVIGDKEAVAALPLEGFEGVENVIQIMKPYKFVSREFRHEPTLITIGDVVIGEGYFNVMAGPCSVESREQMRDTARAVKSSGATVLRGGAFKPRTSPYSFQGLGVDGLKMLAETREEFGLPIVTEVMDPRDLDAVAEYADIIQIGARNAQNFLLLKEVGMLRKPVLLKRGLGNTVEETLMAAEYIIKGGNTNIIICERGIRTFETYTRNTLDISAIPLIKQLSHLPVIVDPSHAAGKRNLVEPLTLAGLAAGADGAMIEVHPDPEKALSDGPQSLTFKHFDTIMERIRTVAEVFNKKMRLTV
ncbi:MAG: 3-deoxy-7-phosphoheptulonate synthase [Candidatus Aquicultor secundus]|nr:3-deoxy-7-phosphoheptulonate synthase [Candidatus Aquicultor secundus]OIO85142.1 MAG: 3-deoxy-7-phosphoheptulonate synthase [Candidatus Aquicultor secundus]PIU26623.1 MAG: 3-deoxy-7-phosphoheptulonate synthase [Candidatus Aquicultor secundus]